MLVVSISARRMNQSPNDQPSATAEGSNRGYVDFAAAGWRRARVHPCHYVLDSGYKFPPRTGRNVVIKTGYR